MHHEQAYADHFNRAIERKAGKNKFHYFSVDGQDRDAGCDYVISDADRFAIIEFKSSERQLPSELKKTRRLDLCKELQNDAAMRSLHDKCHFISWQDSASGLSQTNIYRMEICTQAIFGNACGLTALKPSVSSRVGSEKFADDFFVYGGARSLSLAEFEIYLAWIMQKTSKAKNSTLELLAYEDKSGDLYTFTLKSIADAHAWMNTYKTPSPPKPRSRGPSS